MIDKIYAYSKKKKILKKYAFLPPLTATNPLKRDLYYRSELSGHLFFDNCLNYPNFNYACEKICSLN